MQAEGQMKVLQKIVLGSKKEKGRGKVVTVGKGGEGRREGTEQRGGGGCHSILAT